MIAKISLKKIAAGFAVLVGFLYASAPFAEAQSPAEKVAPAASGMASSLDYESFKNRVAPIFLKKRAGHARCYACHSGTGEGGAPPYLEKLSPGKSSWNEEQSRRIFQRVSRLVVPGKPENSLLVMRPLAPEAGGIYTERVHRGGRQFTSQDDADWRTLAEWVRGGKAAGAGSKN